MLLLSHVTNGKLRHTNSKATSLSSHRQDLTQVVWLRSDRLWCQEDSGSASLFHHHIPKPRAEASGVGDGHVH